MKTIKKIFLTIYPRSSYFFQKIIKSALAKMIFCGRYLKIFFDFLAPKVKIALARMGSFLNKLFLVLGFWEKTALLILSLILLVSLSLFSWEKYTENTILAPAPGGSYTEGILAQKSSDAASVIDQLTKVGLTRFDREGKLQPDLAENWEIKDEGKTYLFHLRDFASSEEVVEILKNKKNGWQDIEVSNPEAKTIEFKLKQAYAPLLAVLSEPLFPFGPYQVKKESKSEIRLEARKDFYLGQPYIEKIILKLYPTEEELQKAFSQKEIDGLAQVIDQEVRRGYNLYSMTLPRWQVLFFNLEKESLQDKAIRQKLKKGEKLDKNLDLTLITLDKEANVAKAEELRTKWRELGLNLNIISRDALNLQKEVIPKRDYDLLLYGIDYGRDPDPYPFWHSSQIKEDGLNLSNFENVDGDKILEEARQTIDEAKRQELYGRFKQILDEEVPAIFFEQTTWKCLVSDKIKGIQDHSGITPADRYNEVWKWWVKEKRVRK